MYISIWNKYLPVLKIILKRALTSDQVLKLNATDFERAGVPKKANIKFNIESSHGKFLNAIKNPPAAKDFSSVIFQDAAIKELFMQNDFSISLSSKYDLTVKLLVSRAEKVLETEPASANS